MAPITTIFRLFTLTAALGQAAAAFSLNVSGPSWDYTTKDLADTTSSVCKEAYSASIDCDETLLKIVASMDPDFNPQYSDLEAMCTTTCSNSLSQYVKKVETACGLPSDLAGVSSGNSEVYRALVATVGQVFQYKYGQACAKNGSDYCYLTYPKSDDWARTEFPCTDECAVQFYQNAHDQRGSAYFFNYFALCEQSSYWEETFAGGWDTVMQCGDGGNDVSSVSTSTKGSSTTTGVVDTSSSTSSSTATPAATAATTATPVRSSSSATSSTATNGASNLRVPFVFRLGA
ncbi:hypothetical protein F1880_003124 [Penicillium rolfsii]|nr:hypothetical protein F1880_003124 [Penicillium rolfsii]